ncbi:MAG: energy transducer TonB [Algoriphagus sp.]|jgi:periplasmic protein TonB|uniref:energy transducer TonB n=1 Tax=Algoriphagus sp. TaxID=1872435 RepID=UPI0027574AB9|nr:energy transducer TonB [Algoriphagus sp.]MDP4748911.1 energy transducer TonB [Algoriphagus sp.]MDP4839941.1 energy transducer TonB [Algoriphagus sp.]MDP4905012.1 energy transducer TonB [Algoriphagus sp.]MDP4957477.1 energy transducer TonB [Algoriphagus sp.]
MEAKKTPSADLTKKVGMFTNLGLAVAVGLTLAAFEYKSFDDSGLKDLGSVADNFEELLDVPITQQPPPPPPPPPMEQPVIEEIPDEVEIEEKIEVNFDVDVKETTVIAEVAIKEVVIEEEKADQIFDVVETQPNPPGGMSGWNKYLSNNLKYPTQARRMGVEGTVIVVFVINTDGSIQDVEVLRGIGGGCDEEAVKVVTKAPKWEPGKQRGKPVRTRMRLPIRFKLS